MGLSQVSSTDRSQVPCRPEDFVRIIPSALYDSLRLIHGTSMSRVTVTFSQSPSAKTLFRAKFVVRHTVTFVFISSPFELYSRIAGSFYYNLAPKNRYLFNLFLATMLAGGFFAPL